MLTKLKVSKTSGVGRPHKYLLLLSLISLMEEDRERKNEFSYTELVGVFDGLVRKWDLSEVGSPILLEYPFFHLQSDGIWSLAIKEEKEKVYAEYQKKRKRLTKNRIMETVDYGYLADDIFYSLKSKQIRNSFKNIVEDSILSGLQHSNPEQNSLFAHEQKAINKITYSVSNDIRVLSNMHIFDRQSKSYFECDLILIAKSGIYVVELKHWTGDIEINQYQWRIDKTKYRADPHKANSFKCKVLKGLYNHNFVTYPNVWVESIVVLTNPEANVENADTPEVFNQEHRHNLTFGSIQDFLSFIRRKEKANQLLRPSEIIGVSDYISRLNKPSVNQREYTVNGYKTVEYLSQKPECIELLARPIGIKAKGMHRLRVFRPIQDTEIERERFKKTALNTLSAVEQIGEDPNINRVWTIQTEDGDIIEVSDWSETGTLQDLISENKTGLQLKDALLICKGIALGLKRAHENNIIHRALKPENILINNYIPRLMNFDLSFQLEDNRLTVIPDSSAVKDDGYVAPELLVGEDIDEATDYFSFGVIMYQILTGEKPFKTTREFVSRCSQLSIEHQRKLKNLKVPNIVIAIILKLVVPERGDRLKDTKEILSALTSAEGRNSIANSVSPPNSRLETGDTYDMYEIVRFIGQGRETQIYKAKAKVSQGQPILVVLKVFNYETPPDRIFKELNLGSEIRSPYVVHYERFPGHWHGKRFFIVEEYVPGSTLRDIIEQGERPNLAMFNSVARSLMEGVRALHEHRNEDGVESPIIHGDIKPENIILTPEPTLKPVIIDLGTAGPPRVDYYQGTTFYIPPESIRGADRYFSQQDDLFALGVTLWEWLFGELPYTSLSRGDRPIEPSHLPGFEDICSWLKKAISTRSGEGFLSIGKMWDDFVDPIITEEKEDNKIIYDKEKVIIELTNDQEPDILKNSFVHYLYSLSCASAGNENAIAENQIHNVVFEKIHVSNPLTEVICRLLEDNNNVILTGNAGDGKTTIAIDVIKKFVGTLTELPALFNVPGQHLIVVKDMSELPKQRRVSILREALDSKDKKYLIVSNTGTLLDAFNTLKDIIGGQFSDVLVALKAKEPVRILNDEFYMINIGQIDSIGTACQVFERMLEPENWIDCFQCELADDCPMCKNSRLLQSNINLVQNRVYLLYKRLYEYGQRLTMRQMIGHLAYAITGGLRCQDIENMSLPLRRKQIGRASFVNQFFGDDGHEPSPSATNLIPVQVIQQAGFGLDLIPEFERRAWLKGEINDIFDDNARGVCNYFLDAPHAIDSSVVRRQVRRLAFFFGSFESNQENIFVTTFLKSPMLINYLQDTYGENVPSKTRLRQLIAKILHILQEYFVGIRLPEHSYGNYRRDIFITLRPPRNISVTQIILAHFRDDDFELKVTPRYQYEKEQGSNNIFVLNYIENPDVYLTLDLPFFDYVAKRYEGDLTYQLSAYYANRLEDFKGKLIKSCTDSSKPSEDEELRLLRILSNRGFEELTLCVGQNKLEVV